MVSKVEAVTHITKYLKESGYRVASRDMKNCYVVSAQKDDKVYVISVTRGSMTGVYVAKVVAPELLLSAVWDCELLEYSPHGYYVLEMDVEKLMSGITKKLEVLDKVYRHTD